MKANSLHIEQLESELQDNAIEYDKKLKEIAKENEVTKIYFLFLIKPIKI